MGAARHGCRPNGATNLTIRLFAARQRTARRGVTCLGARYNMCLPRITSRQIDYKNRPFKLQAYWLIQSEVLQLNRRSINRWMLLGCGCSEVCQRTGNFFQYLVTPFNLVPFGKVRGIIVSEPHLTGFVLPNKRFLWQINRHALCTVH